MTYPVLQGSHVTIGVDLGSSAVKVVAAEPGGGVVAASAEPVALTSPQPGWAEADPEEWWQATCRATRAVMSSLGPCVDVDAVASAGMVPAVVCLDRHARPLGPGLLQNDARATEEIDEITTELEHLDMLTITGSIVSQQSVAPTTRWLQRHQPERWRIATRLVGSYDYLMMRMGAEPHVEFNWAIESGLFDLKGRPVPEVWAAGGLAVDQVPEVRHPGDLVGSVGRRAAAELGIPAGVPLRVGGADHVMSAYAAGLTSEGQGLVKLGGAGDILAVSTRPVTDRRLYLDAHPVPGLWLPNGCMATSGSMLRWLQGVHGRKDLEVLDSEASSRPPASLVALPYLLGEKSPHHDARLRGAFVGLHLGTTTADLHRATLEAIAYGFRQHVEILREAGVNVSSMRVSNGGSRSVLWKQILADVLDLPLQPVANFPGASLGAAYAASVQKTSDWLSAITATRYDTPLTPTPDAVSVYDEGYRTFLDLQEAVNPLSRRLARRSNPVGSAVHE